MPFSSLSIVNSSSSSSDDDDDDGGEEEEEEESEQFMHMGIVASRLSIQDFGWRQKTGHGTGPPGKWHRLFSVGENAATTLPQQSNQNTAATKRNITRLDKAGKTTCHNQCVYSSSRQRGHPSVGLVWVDGKPTKEPRTAETKRLQNRVNRYFGIQPIPLVVLMKGGRLEAAEP